MRRAASLVLPLLLAACATTGPGMNGRPAEGGPRPPVMVGPTGERPASPLARSATYACEDLTTVVITEGQVNAQVTLNSGLELGLARQPAASGLRYGGAPFEFRTQGTEGTFINSGKAARCRIK
jgi:membrane-bound inhibitor of C-type lysozyme